jgi:hypothetical protein
MLEERNMFTCRRIRVCLLIPALIVAALATARGDTLAGAWTMVKYEGSATHGSATGLLLFADGRFSLTYRMDDAGEHWGRAHAGTYEVNGDRLTYHVGWSMEYVAGKPSVAAKPSDRETTFSLAGDTLTITFSNGSVQTFKRAR